MTRARLLLISLVLLASSLSCTPTEKRVVTVVGTTVAALCVAMGIVDPVELAICAAAPDIATLINELAAHRAALACGRPAPSPSGSAAAPLTGRAPLR